MVLRKIVSDNVDARDTARLKALAAIVLAMSEDLIETSLERKELQEVICDGQKI